MAQHNTQMPHAAFSGQTPDEICFGTAADLAAELAAARDLARAARLAANLGTVLATILIRREIAWINRVRAGAATSFVVEPLP